MLKNAIISKIFASPRERMIRYVAKTLAEKRHQSVHAVVSGFAMPQRVLKTSTGEWHIPEVTSMKDGQIRLYAVETKGTVMRKETDSRWKLFAEYAKQNKALFYIVFPVGLILQIKQKLEQLNIEAYLWQASEDETVKEIFHSGGKKVNS
jgi:hypothetical protein